MANIVVSNITISDMMFDQHSPIFISSNGVSNCEISDFTLKNIQASHELVQITGCGVTRDFIYQNISLKNSGLLSLATINGGSLSSISLSEINLSGSGISNLFTLENEGVGELLVEDFNFTGGTLLTSKNFIALSNSLGTTKISDFSFDSVWISDSTSLVKIFSVGGLELGNFSLVNTSTVGQEDRSCLVVDMTQISSTISNNVTLNGITATNSRIGILSVSNSLQAKDIDQYITLDGLVISDVEFDVGPAFISLGPILSDGIFMVILKNLDIQNISYLKISPMIVFGHQTEEFCELRDSHFRNVTNSAMDLIANDENNGMTTKTLLYNVTVDTWY